MDGHHPAPPSPGEDRHAGRNARYGLVLFFIYLALYAGFLLLNAFAPEQMGEPFVLGLNLAVVYGLGLIFAAFALALVYAWLCREGAP
jgi:uncharacterized membrane protein (DUF485 family)